VIVSTTGIVIKSFNYRETSKIVDIYTEAEGLISLVAKGVRKNKKTLGVLEPLNIVFISYYRKSSQSLYLLSKVETIQSFHKLTDNYQKLLTGLMILELIHQTQPIAEPNNRLFNLTTQTLEKLKRENINPYFILTYFIVFLLKDIGIDFVEKINELKNLGNFVYLDLTNGNVSTTPSQNNFARLKKGTVELIRKLNNLGLDGLNQIENIDINIIEMLTFFEKYISFYLDKKIIFRTIELFNNGI
jgi:DNA repair protein RecO (recombination protein O)